MEAGGRELLMLTAFGGSSCLELCVRACVRACVQGDAWYSLVARAIKDDNGLTDKFASFFLTSYMLVVGVVSPSRPLCLPLSLARSLASRAALVRVVCTCCLSLLSL